VRKILSLIPVIFALSACDDFVSVDPPRITLTKEAVFDNDQTANAAMLDLYDQLANSGFASGTQSSISFWCTYLSDEQINYYQGGSTEENAAYQQFNDNEIQANNIRVLSLWSDFYNTVYKANTIIEGLNSSSSRVSPMVKAQLEGEAKFVRALCYFYLTNLWGDVPLALTTDYRKNSEIGRTPKIQVYGQIISDLLEAGRLLPDNYTFSNNERTRATTNAANAFLARVYLYLEDWVNAELYATAVISNSSFYSLAGTLNEVFKTTSQEAILQWWNQYRPNDRLTFRVPSLPLIGAMRSAYATSIEPGDLRNSWINMNTLGYYNARKYTSVNDLPAMEYSTVFRLAEQHLIRAEARAQQDNITEAQEDINIIRRRAGLTDTPATDKATLLLAIENERKFELFAEWGHRWFDLVRTHRAEAVLSPVKPDWDATDILLPIPEQEIKNNIGLKGSQNPGY
jgi:starch-binding outer membrane protein, SusD/RagB family